MAQNFIQPGEHLTLTNNTGANIASGSPVFDGQIVGIALGDIANNAVGQVKTQGVFSLTKKASLVVSEGDALFWDATPGEITKTAADGRFIGYAAAGALSADTHVTVLLVQVPKVGNVVQNATANGSDLATTQALANSLKTTVNNLLTALKNSGVMTPDA